MDLVAHKLDNIIHAWQQFESGDSAYFYGLHDPEDGDRSPYDLYHSLRKHVEELRILRIDLEQLNDKLQKLTADVCMTL